MTFSLKMKSVLDYKVCYGLWAKERISLYKISDILMERGLITRPVTPPAIERGSWLYALQNLQEAKTDTVAIAHASGQIFNESEFWKEIINKARRFYSKKQYNEFMIKNSFLRSYE